MLVSPSAPLILPIGEDVYIRVRELKINGVLISDATVTWVVLDEDENAVAGSTGTSTPVVGTAGSYRGTLDASITSGLTQDHIYFVDVRIDQGANDGFRRIKCVAKYRGST